MVNSREIDVMIPFYGNLIARGKKTIEEISVEYKEDVKKWLIDNGHAELAIEDV